MNVFMRVAIMALCFNIVSCSVKEPVSDMELECVPGIFPDYTDITIPRNIAPLRFRLQEAADEAVVVISSSKEKMVVKADDGNFMIDEGEWKDMMDRTAGDSLSVKIYICKDRKWIGYSPVKWYVSEDTVDSWLVYRLIEPGYELWNKMGIYQRNLTSFHEEAILTNMKTDNNCMNCHSFCNNSPELMSLHMRAKLGGTYLCMSGEIDKISPEKGSVINSFVYPFWHPSGKYITYSSNNIRQAFHSNDDNRIEVFDLSADISVYDVRNNKVLTDSLIASAGILENLPSFSADGKTLYFCSAKAGKIPDDYRNIKFSLCSIGFDAEKGRFGDKVDTLYNSRIDKGSASFPRESPDGKFMVYTVSDYGYFSIWHKEADLYMMNLETGERRRLDEANSDNVESYHSWSSNGRWMVVSSRRDDGLYTRPYIFHIDNEGNCSKAFVIPQENPSFYEKIMYSFNIPEFVKSKVKLDKDDLLKKAR